MRFVGFKTIIFARSVSVCVISYVRELLVLWFALFCFSLMLCLFVTVTCHCSVAVTESEVMIVTAAQDQCYLRSVVSRITIMYHLWQQLRLQNSLCCLQHFVNTQMMVQAEPKLLRTLRRSDVHSDKVVAGFSLANYKTAYVCCMWC